MSLTQSSESSKSTTETDCANCGDWRAKCMESDERGSMYWEMLDELLSLIHRDGGQYTLIAGVRTSFEDAKKKIESTYPSRR